VPNSVQPATAATVTSLPAAAAPAAPSAATPAPYKGSASALQIQKVNPLANWSLDEVKAEIKKYNIPYNVLHDKGFVSIGCQPCTRAIQEGEDFRAGRWWWEEQSKKECGLHG
jgi:3'-phosphoadenosine 5'-phosphosulfate sulfotransferase (PAPS reductase)/FAD synthetase